MTDVVEFAVALRVNGSERTIACPPTLTAARLLRERLGLTGTKIGCGVGECGACTVLVDGEPLLACLLLAVELDGASITTIEGLAADDLSPLQRAFLATNGAQCGFCTPGMIMADSAIAPGADEVTIRAALAGNICRCTGYSAIVAAVQLAELTR